MKKVKCKAVIFDLWDTIFSHGFEHEFHPLRLAKDLLVKAGARKEDVYPTLFKTLNVMDYGEDKILFSDLCTELGIKLTPKLEKNLKAIWDQGAIQTKLFEDVEPVLKILKKNFKIGLLSNTSSYKMQYLIDKTKIDSLFNEMLFSFDAGVAKPDKKAFDLIAKKLQISNTDCVFVGDQLSQDILGAANAGMKPVFLDRAKKHSIKPKEAVAMINDLRQLLELIEYG
ncbi:MAG: HAD family hydrolase [Candidatus Diapherotrites archaeon]|nr:HAD family hydrolase [Candidatus Diapherotrites archaeon]